MGSITFNIISIHAAREGGDFLELILAEEQAISIHAAREGGDLIIIAVARNAGIISIHAAREGGDAAEILWLQDRSHFNPRRP